MSAFVSHLKQWLRPLAPFLLLLILLVSAVSVVGMKQHARSLQMRSQELIAERERLGVEFNQLRLERGTIGAHARIEGLATRQLNMKVPDEYAIVQIPAAE